MKLLPVSVVLVLGLLNAACQGEQDIPRGPNSQARHTAFKTMMPNYTNMVQMANGSKGYQKAEFQQLVARFEAEAQQPFNHFQQDGAGMNGKAKDGVWSQHQEFEAQEKHFFAAIDEVKLAAEQGNQDDIRAAIKNVDKQCMACHAQFRD